MKKIINLLLVCLLVFTTGCTTEKEETAYSVLCPEGAPTLAFLSSYNSIIEEGKFDVTKGTDQLIAEFNKSDSEYNVIVAPINVGAKLTAKEDSQYELAGILTWGNLYIVGTDESELNKEGEILLFGEGAVPQKVYEASQFKTSLESKYLSGADLVSSALASGQATVGLLAEPAVTATIAKAKQNNIELKVLADLQEVYKTNTNQETYGYPQAALFVKKGLDASDLTDELKAYTADMSEAETYLNEITSAALGLPAEKVVISSLPRQNVKYVEADEVQEEIDTFLSNFK